jgi:hypothetical protein
MTTSNALALRKQLLNIDENTAHNVRLVAPVIRKNLDSMVERLYRHLLSFPECARLLPERTIGALKAKQVSHWWRMLDCAFDDAYIARALRIGQLHFDHRVPPYIYLAAYNYMQSLVLACVASEAQLSRSETSAVLSSLSRIIMLDIDLAMAAYTRAVWSGPSSAEDVYL